MANDDFRQAQTLDIPNGTTFEFKDGKLIFGHESDIVIRTNMGGYKFQKIFSKKGSVQVMPLPGVEFDVDEIEALSGDIFLNGRVRVRSARAKTIHFQEGALVAERLEAVSEAVLSGESLDVLYVKAARVVVDADAQGTVLVVESENDIGRFRAHGGFRSLDEARQALQRMDALAGGGASPRPAAAAAPAPRPAPPPASTAVTAAAPPIVSRPAPPVVASPPPSATQPLPLPGPAAARPTLPARPPEAREVGPFEGDATIIAPRERPGSTTEEFRAPFTGATDSDSTSALPKSSVFRKRK